jgi:hypothetical protein
VRPRLEDAIGDNAVSAAAGAAAAAAAASHWTADANSARDSQSAGAVAVGGTGSGVSAATEASHWTPDASSARDSQSAAPGGPIVAPMAARRVIIVGDSLVTGVGCSTDYEGGP